MKKFKFEPNWAPHPGLTLSESMVHTGISPAKVAKAAHCKISHVNDILTGKAAIDEGFAAGLAELFPGVSADFWLTLERNYQEVMGIRGLN